MPNETDPEFWKIIASEFPDNVGDWLKDRQPPPESWPGAEMTGMDEPIEQSDRDQLIFNASLDERIVDYFIEAEGSFATEEALIAALERDYGINEDETEVAIDMALEKLGDITAYMEPEDMGNYGEA